MKAQLATDPATLVLGIAAALCGLVLYCATNMVVLRRALTRAVTVRGRISRGNVMGKTFATPTMSGITGRDVRGRDVRGRRTLSVVAVLLIVVGCVLIACGTAKHARPATPTASRPGVIGPQTAAPLATGLGLPAARPVRVIVPAIDVNAPLMRLGLMKDGTLEVPPLSEPGLAGWYAKGPSPGERGPAVIAGHVNTKRGPSVFSRLSELKTGEMIRVRRADGTTPVFVVSKIEQVRKTAFPTQHVYGATNEPELRLITCGGKFNSSTGHYLDNIIVYARMSGVSPTSGTPSPTATPSG